MADLTYPLYPILAFVGFILALVPLPWHLKAWNSGTCFYMFWASLACLNQFVNSVVWHNNAINWSPAWCEVSIRIMMGSSVALPASSLCISRRLYYIISASAASSSAGEKKRALFIDCCICLLLPILYIVLQYVVQGHRFNIYEDIGCYPALFHTHLVYFTSFMWPILIGCISATYCVLTLRIFFCRRLEFANILAHSSITTWRYFRLMALAMTEILLTTPLAVLVIYLNLSATPVEPWRSWEDTHFNYSRIGQIPTLFWKMNRGFVASVEFTRWVVPVCALVFFAFFGFAEEARNNYRAFFATVRGIVCNSIEMSSRRIKFNTTKDKEDLLSSQSTYQKQEAYRHSDAEKAFDNVTDMTRPSISVSCDSYTSTNQVEMIPLTIPNQNP